MRILFGFILGAIVMSGISIAQEGFESSPIGTDIFLPMPIYPSLVSPSIQSLPPMPVPQWQSVKPC